jgi:NAD(P)-dependent dehydrogenase (short-subunit alcohol dehydrogenase family)
LVAEKETGRSSQEQFDIRGRVAVVTGASSGIGAELARSLAEAGARVALAARRRDVLEELAAELGAKGSEAIAVPTDVTREAEVERLVSTVVDRFGGIDILVNNAGITRIGPAEDESLEQWNEVVAVNQTAAFLMARGCGRVMLEAGRGSIVNVGSILGIVGCGQVPQAGYVASKGAVTQLTRELAAQWARRGVRVNCIAPGWFETEMTASVWHDERSQAWMRGRTPMGRTGELRELGGVLLFLASDASSYVTGQVIAVDGGWTII